MILAVFPLFLTLASGFKLSNLDIENNVDINHDNTEIHDSVNSFAFSC